MPTPEKLKLPRIENVILRNFSLYNLNNEIDERFAEGVFCLAGANGLGKSTFLTAMNFALTGIVPQPDRGFKSIDEYYKHCLPFAKEFFDGRITEKDRDGAEIEIKFSLGKTKFTLVRGLFTPESLRKLEIAVDTDGAIHTEVLTIDDTEESKIHDTYAQRVVAEIGIESFPQFVFLQLFVFTFDERRHLIFWDSEVLQQCLYLTFGFDFAAAQKADILNRESQRQDSLARNCNYQATELRKKIDDLRKAAEQLLTDNTAEDIVEEYKRLEVSFEEKKKKMKVLQNKLDDATLLFSDFSASYSVLKAEYAQEFEKQLEKHSPVSMHPVVLGSIATKECQLCGARGESVVEKIKQSIAGEHCILCGTEVSGTNAPKKDFEKLKQIDKKISECKEKIDGSLKTVNRLRQEYDLENESFENLEKEKVKIEKENKNLLTSVDAEGTGDSTTAIIERYKASMNDYLERKANHYKKRNEKRKELKDIQKNLEQKYLEAQKDFVPLFRNLAERFLGLDIEVELQTQENSPGMTLELKIGDSKRRETHQLSESQRFFVDIALRMALAQYVSNDESKACIFIDTPEGSLDIAYESRAGEMLSKFVTSGHQLILTANINSSKLIRKLAQTCGRAKMQLCRMTSWAQLSEVQISEEAIFEGAFQEIEAALDGRGA